MKKTVSQVIVDFMKFLGIKYCFGIPGSNVDLFFEISNNKEISSILTKHEQGAAFMATGFTKSSGIISSCFGSVGPGATNLITGIASAYEDSQPILVLTGQVSKCFHGHNAFQESTGKGRTINQRGLFKHITIYGGKLYDESNLLEELKKVYLALLSSRPGPVYLEIANDIMTKEVRFPFNFFKNLKKNINNKFPIINLKKLEKIKNLIINSHKLIILAGGGSLYSDVSNEIVELAEILNCPVITSLKGRGIISEDHYLSLGCLGITGQRAANEYIKSGVDLVLAIGISFHQFTTKNWTLPLKNTKIIRFDIIDKHRTKNYKETLLIEGSLGVNLKKLINFLKSKQISKLYKKNINIIDFKKKYKQDEMNHTSSLPLKPQIFVAELRKNLPRDSIICTESIPWTEKYFEIYKPRTHIVSTGLAPIGCSLSEALGAKLANPEKIVVSLEGDCGFQMIGLELMTAVNYEIPIIAIVLNNGILGPIYHSQKKIYGKTFCAEFKNPSYVKLAKSFGILGLKINKRNKIKKVIKKALKSVESKKPVLIEVVVSPNEDWTKI